MTLRLVAVVMIIALEGAAFASPSAEELYEQGETSFNKGEFATAAAKWKESYRLSKEPLLLFNIAQALRRDARCAEALATYRKFVAVVPQSDERPLADEAIRELAPKCDVVDPREKKAASREDRPERSDDNLGEVDSETRPARLKIAGVALAGAGVVSVVTGLYFGHRASSLGEEVTNECRTGCDWAVYGPKDREGRSAETKQNVFAGIGLAAIIGGGVLFWLGSREQGPAPIAFTPAHDGAAVSWTGKW